MRCSDFVEESAMDEDLIREWFYHIGETDEATIREFQDTHERVPSANVHFLGRETERGIRWLKHWTP